MGKDDKLIIIFMRDDSRIRQYEVRYIWMKVLICSLALLLLCAVSITATVYFQWSRYVQADEEYRVLQKQLLEKQMLVEEKKQKLEKNAWGVCDEDKLSIKHDQKPPYENETSINLSQLFAEKDLKMVSVRNMHLQLHDKNLRLEFELYNLTDKLITGKITAFVITRDASTFQAQGNDRELSFAIRNFRVVDSLLGLPSELTKEEVFGLRLVISCSNGQKLFTHVYIMSSLVGKG